MIARIGRSVGGVCLLSGATLLVCAASVTVRSWLWQERSARRLEMNRCVPADGRLTPPGRGEPVGRLRLPRLGIDTVVVEGTDKKSLSLGPGHMEGSGLPGEPDNCIIAGHRDGAFGSLQSARPGDVVELTYRSSRLRYRIHAVHVTDKSDARALAPSSEAILTLVTCYPIHYVGRAKQRLVVRAALLDGPSEAGQRLADAAVPAAVDAVDLTGRSGRGDAF